MPEQQPLGTFEAPQCVMAEEKTQAGYQYLHAHCPRCGRAAHHADETNLPTACPCGNVFHVRKK